ncbi:copper chaperone PCu(A)C [Candidatus Endowatersipora endosymbiont of Watersipora subatra]|uniref:copper chaperone PCu(A)C n=1 Tax=Candidatus Endowatersipora endosymbiont of Watersipora subatra TaxID=3077946 RepID=UPI00312C9708
MSEQDDLRVRPSLIMAQSMKQNVKKRKSFVLKNLPVLSKMGFLLGKIVLFILFSMNHSTLVLSKTISTKIRAGKLILHDPVIRMTQPGSEIGAGYLMITNNGSIEDRLISVRVDFAQKVRIHETIVARSEMEITKMRTLEDGLKIGVGETVKLEPSSYHLMFIKLSKPMKVGDLHKAILEFENAGKVEVQFEVISIAETLKIKNKIPQAYENSLIVG